MAEAKTYLGKLEFREKYLNTLAGKYLQNIRLMVIMLIALIGFGVYAFISIPRTLNPEVNIPVVSVATVLPGAGPEDIESLVTIPLEREINNVDKVNNYQSSSQTNVSVISVEFTEEVEPTEARNLVQTAVDKVNLPSEANEPSIQAFNFNDFPVVSMALTKKENSDDVASLMRLGERFEDYIVDNDLIDRVETHGLLERRIHVQLEPTRLQELGLSPFAVVDAVSKGLKSYPAGDVQTDQTNFSLTIDQPVVSIDDLRQRMISWQGQNYELGQLAVVSERTRVGQLRSYFADNDRADKPTAVFDIYKTASAELDEAGREIRADINSFIDDYPGYEANLIYDYSELINEQFSELGNNFWQTLALVFLSMFLLYGLSQASIAAAAIPLALLTVFISMQWFGIKLNFISIFSVLIALGLFVDNAVVIIEAFTSYYRTGKYSPLQTAILVWRDYSMELFTINLLTVWAFLPLLISRGIIGEFIYPIPIIVSVSMFGSAGVAILFTLPAMMILADFRMPKRVKRLLIGMGVLLVGGLGGLGVFRLFGEINIFFALTLSIWLFVLGLGIGFRKKILRRLRDPICETCFYQNILKHVQRAGAEGFISLRTVSRMYRVMIEKIITSRSARRKVLIVIGIFTVFSYLLVPLGLVENEFFPKSDQDRVYVQVEQPSGTINSISERETLKIMNEIRDLEEIDFMVGSIGRQTYFDFSSGSPSENTSEISLKLVPGSQRKKTSIEIAQDLRNELGDYQQGEVKVLEETSGPPAGADLQIGLLGSDLSQLESYAKDVEDFLAELEGTTNIDRSIKRGASKLAFVPDPSKLIDYGVSEEDISFWLRTTASGFEIDNLEVEDKDLAIVLRFNQQKITPELINTIQIPTQRGLAGLDELGEMELRPDPTRITRQNGQRTITVTASALPGYTPTELNEKLEAFADNGLGLVQGYSWQVGGINEENQQSVESILQAMIISFILIIGTMVIQLGSFRKAFIVILVIPLAVSGVFVLFALTGTPLSFPALIGILALFGIVIANSLMIVNKIILNEWIGLPLEASITDAAASRLEPIVLTTASQVIGLIPITLSDPLWRGMGGAIIAGMTFSGTIMLLFIPVVYYYLFRKK